MGMISDATLRHRAVQIAAELPSDPDAAFQVLKYAREVVESFFRPRIAVGAEILTYPALVSTSSSERASATDSPSGTPYQSQSVLKPGTA